MSRAPSTCLALGAWLAPAAAAMLACGGGGGGSSRSTVAVTIDPRWAYMDPGGIQTFTATVANATDTAVIWDSRMAASNLRDLPCGSITADGVFTAPATYEICVVTAKARADPTAVGSVYAWVEPKVSGTATYRDVPVTLADALDFAHQADRPIRLARVEVRQVPAAGGAPRLLGYGTTDLNGAYAIHYMVDPLAVAPPEVWVFAEHLDSVKVQDGTTSGWPTWVLATPIAGPTVDPHATLGWTGSSYDAAARKAAPFAILDRITDGMLAIAEVRPDLDVLGGRPSCPLVVSWSPSSTGAEYSGSGCGGTITLSGRDGIDTDEFDSHVILHEWSHYFQTNYGRNDSLGGYHPFGTALDPRVSFSEGLADALPAMVLRDTTYVDTSWRGAGVQSAWGFDAETEVTGGLATDDPTPSGFSETSVMRFLYDLYDDTPAESVPSRLTGAASTDGVSLGLKPIVDVLTGPQRTTPAFTTLASFVPALKAANPSSAAAIDALAAHYGVDAITDVYGTGDPGLSGIYATVPVDGLATSLTFRGSMGFNTRPNNQYYVVRGGAAASTWTAIARSTYRVDLRAFQGGYAVATGNNYAANQQITFPVPAGGTVIVVVEGGNFYPGPQPAYIPDYAADVCVRPGTASTCP